MDDTLPVRQRRSAMRPILLTALASFLLGGGIVGAFALRDRGDPPAAQPFSETTTGTLAQRQAAPSLITPTPSPSATRSEAAAVAQITQQQGGIDQRLAAAEQRLARLDLQAQAAAGNAARAEGLLIAFATRRAIEKKAELGYLADQLRLRFGDALPNAVDTVIAFSRNPVTVVDLSAQLGELAPELEYDDRGSRFSRLSSELARLFTIRRETTPSPQPEMRLERARAYLESGRVEDAIAEIRNMPGEGNAQAWLRNAERYVAARRALDLIETAAILEPNRLRDAAGNRVAQPSPAEGE